MTANAFDVVYKLEVPADVDIMNAVCPTWPKVSVPQITWNQPTIQWDDRIATITCHHEATNGEREYWKKNTLWNRSDIKVKIIKK